MKIKRNRSVVILLLALFTAFTLTSVAYAHGVIITYTLKANGQLELHAEFDTGEPMGEAQVTIYSPEDPLTPWLTGVADEMGDYIVVLDPDLVGAWDVQFRKAGHGDIIYIQLEAGLIDPALVVDPPGDLMGEPLAAEMEAAPVDDVKKSMEDSLKISPAVANQAETAVKDKAIAEAETTAEDKAISPETVVETKVLAPVETDPERNAVDGQDAVIQTGNDREAVPVISSGGNTATSGGFSSLQILLMSASVIWGFVGTALYFSNKKTQAHDQAHGHHHF